MEQYLVNQIMDKLAQGNLTEFVAYVLIFIFIWIEVRGMKKELTKLNTTVSNGFAEGEKRFEDLENSKMEMDTRLTKIETRFETLQIQMSGFEHKLGGKKS